MRAHPERLIATLLVFCMGCTTAQTSNTARTATEQLLISNAIDQSLDKVDFRPFAGQSVYLEEKYVDSVDKQYVIASVRHRILRAGGKLVDKADAADVVLEPRSGGIGTTASSSFLGIPEITLPGMLTLPEVRFFTRSRQAGYAKIGLAAYDPKSHQSLGPGGMSVARADDSNYYVVGIGPIQSGSLKAEITRTTTGQAAVTRDRMPPLVVFDGRPKTLEQVPDAIEITSDQQAGGQQTSGTTEGTATVRPSPFYEAPTKAP
jgi:hypothetical protein